MVALKKQRKLTNKEIAEGIKPSIAEKKTDAIWLGDYRDFRHSELKPITRNFLERLCKEIIEWAHKQDVEERYDIKGREREIRLDRFYFDYGIPFSTWKDWKTRYPFFGETIEEAQRILGRRREKDIYYNDGVAREGTRKDLGQFLGEYREDTHDLMKMKLEIDKELYELKSKLESKATSGVQYITLSVVPDTGKVKPREKKEKDGEV